jgi:hypothetical protein
MRQINAVYTQAFNRWYDKMGRLLQGRFKRIFSPGCRSSVLPSGPFAETKEQLGGYFLIEVPDLDAALSWAARCPAVQYGAVEVRPVWT